MLFIMLIIYFITDLSTITSEFMSTCQFNVIVRTALEFFSLYDNPTVTLLYTTFALISDNDTSFNASADVNILKDADVFVQTLNAV